MKILPDIDIDVANRDKVLENLTYIPASILKDNKLIKHNVGVYFHDIPIDPTTGLASIDYKNAEERGYFKIDFLNLNIYKEIRDEEHLMSLMNTEPIWELLEYKEIVDQLFHLNGHFDVVQKMKPSNIKQLAMVLGMIRPGKKYLIGKTWDEVEQEIWNVTEHDQYSWKKSHAFAYAAVVIIQLNLIVENNS